jgi:DNA-binding transcriptional ArsR family regulator
MKRKTTATHTIGRRTKKENKEAMDSNKVVIVPLGEKSGEVNSVLANETARKILNLISDEPLSAMPIAYKLNLAINTAQYNLERLEAVGLVEVIRVDKSKKGRDVKIYAPTNKIIAIVPKNVKSAGIYDALKGLVPLFIIALVLSIGIDVLMYTPDEGFVPTFKGADAQVRAQAAEVAALSDAESTNEVEGEYALGYGKGEPQEEDAVAGAMPAKSLEISEEADSPPPEALAQESYWQDMQIKEEDDIFDRPGFWVFIGAMGIILFFVLEQKRKSIQ